MIIMKAYKYTLTLTLLCCSLAIITACTATRKQITEHEAPVWPLPPDTPRIKYIESISGSQDLKQSWFSRFLSSIVGKNNEHRLSKPYGVSASADGTIFIAETGKDVVMVFDRKKGKVRYFGNKGHFDKLAEPVNVIWSPDGKLYIADAIGKRVVILDEKGNYINAIGRAGEFERPTGLALNYEKDLLYIVDTPAHKVNAYKASTGAFMFSFGEHGNELGQFHFPTNIAVTSAGDVCVVDSMHFAVQIFSTDGKFKNAFGKAGGNPGFFSRPRGIAVDSEDHIYVVDALQHAVQIFDSEGRLLLVFGGEGNSEGRFLLPAGIWIDKNDHIYVSDSINARIQIFQYLPETKAHASAKGIK